ncbi:hypothetical protein H5410_004954 [Solanum commersonii]|uniref:Uncharacterized protein n=1 Tax=Solanum commersonii TaxID=4109 RepID=A0A9J6A5U5_SOLCO|nr:hypothetical protein H5410_004954 [Solanum commersonii]
MELFPEIKLKQRIPSRCFRRSNTSQGGLHHPTFENYTTDIPQITEKSGEKNQENNIILIFSAYGNLLRTR